MAKNLMILYGKKSVTERLKINPSSIRKIFLQDNFTSSEIKQDIIRKKIRFSRLSEKHMKLITKAKNTQGIIAKVEQFEYTPFDTIINQPDKKQPILVFLDRINDPHNVGVIMRTLACFGECALILPESETCGVNDTAMHVSMGGENYLPIARVRHLSETLALVKGRGYHIIGAMPDEKAENINSASFTFPVAVVFGSEKDGISQELHKLLDRKIHIPAAGAPLSLNVTVACGIVCNALLGK